MQSSKTEGLPALDSSAGQLRRSPMQMICDVLGVLSNGPTKPTHILYKANMSWKVLTSFLDYLLRQGLIERDDQGGKRSLYKLTNKGRSILELYDGLRMGLTGAVEIGKDDKAGQILEKAAMQQPREVSSIWM